LNTTIRQTENKLITVALLCYITLALKSIMMMNQSIVYEPFLASYNLQKTFLKYSHYVIGLT